MGNLHAAPNSPQISAAVGVVCRGPVEAHWAIGRIERAHPPLRRAYEIIEKEIGYIKDDRIILQIAVKALNDTAGPKGLVRYYHF